MRQMRLATCIGVGRATMNNQRDPSGDLISLLHHASARTGAGDPG